MRRAQTSPPPNPKSDTLRKPKNSAPSVTCSAGLIASIVSDIHDLSIGSDRVRETAHPKNLYAPVAVFTALFLGGRIGARSLSANQGNRRAEWRRRRADRRRRG